MEQQNKRRLIVSLFIVGVLVGFIFNAFVVWANFEASMWNQLPNQDAALDGLRCPLIMTQSDKATIKIAYKNTLDRTINPVIRTFISERLVSVEREETVRPEIAPGETAWIEHAISGDEAIWSRFILVRVNALPQFTLPARNGSCGILVVNIPLVSGGVIVVGIILISVAGIGSALWMWPRLHILFEGRVKKAYQAMIFLSVAVVGGIILELLSVWIVATFLLVLTFILMVAVLAYLLASA